jgi:hypothetical protein
MRHSLLFAAIIFIFPLPARAELHECNGIWTNVPCAGTPERTIQEAPKRDTTVTKDQSQRSLWFHDLEMAQIKAQREYQVDVSIDNARAICSDTRMSAESCKRAITARRSEIDHRVHDAEDLRLKRAENDKRTDSGTTETVVVQNNQYLLPRPTIQPPPIVPTTLRPRPLPLSDVQRDSNRAGPPAARPPRRGNIAGHP